jgi:ACS family hexuronate transporter-like MFS transporter
MASVILPEIGRPPVNVGRYRWVICGLLFAATAINYVDRQMIGVLKPTLQGEFHWTEGDFATIVFWFQVAYAVGYISFGRIVDLAWPPASRNSRWRGSGWESANRAISPPACAP